MEDTYIALISTMRRFTNSTIRDDDEDVKRSINYLEWLDRKTKIITDERKFILTDEINDTINRCSVAWVHFGFNIGSEFGGHHPAVVIRKMGNGLYVIPLDSGNIPEDKKNKDYFIKIPYVYGFSRNMPRHCNIYNMVKIDWRRIDFESEIGSISGKVMNKISDALKKYKIY